MLVAISTSIAVACKSEILLLECHDLIQIIPYIIKLLLEVRNYNIIEFGNIYNGYI